LLLAGSFLFAILYPSFDGIGHLEETLAEKHCDHKYAQGKNEINHSHHELEKCFACEFTFSQFISAEIFSFGFKTPVTHSGYSISISREIVQFFRGSLFSLRGPPVYC
jgi:hypothetical protein